MNAAAFHFAGGDALFSGAALIVAGCAARSRWSGPRAAASARLAVLVGAGFVGLSATPLSGWFYTVWAVVLLVWLATPATVQTARWRHVTAALLAALCIAAAAGELARLRRPSLPRASFDQVAVIGDSISAQLLGSREQVWPARLQAACRIPVANLAQPGATATSALEHSDRLPEGPVLVIVEIGGNDLLGPKYNDLFERDLRRLLARLRERQREIVMLELPLPPLFNSYGRIQRRLAAEYGVHLIHRRHFARVLFGPGTTLDGLHLSERGHAAMAEMIRQQIGHAFK